MTSPAERPTTERDERPRQTTERDERPISFAATLAARGVPDDLPLALGATITASRLRASSEGRHGTLPRVSLSFPEPADMSLLPEDDRELEVLSLLGAGGMGAVYLARQRSLDREVAVKTTRDGAGAEATAALCAEAVVTGHLEHPGIVPIHQLATAPDGRPVLVMKRIEGTSWRALLVDAEHAAWRTIGARGEDRRAFHLEVLGRVCEALAFAHSRGIVHRDVKPENVMVGAFGEVYLVDWGLAVRESVPRAGEPLVGTPLYMAPEMVAGGAIDARTDVFLLGATLHEVLTGAPPHRGETLHQVLLAAYEARPPEYGPEIPSDLADLCRRAMAFDPGARPRDAGVFREALADHARHRASRALIARADERLAELRARISDTIAETELPSLYRLVAESRFAYLEAQRESPSSEAIEGLQGSLECAVAIELARRDPGAARALLSELPKRSDALEARVVELERAKERERAEADRLQRLAEGADASAQPRLRLALAGLGTLIALLVSIYAGRRAEAVGTTVTDLLLFSLMTSGLVIVGLATLGRGLWRQAFNRRFANWAVISSAALIVNRAVGLGSGIEVRTMLTHDLVLLAVCFAFGAAVTFPVLGIAAVSLLAGAMAIDLAPQHATAIFSGSGLASMVVVGVAVMRARRAKPSAAP